MAIPFTPNIITSGYNLEKLNENFTMIATAFEEALSRNGSTPNQMGSDLDMNSNDLLNVHTLQVADITIDGEDPQGILERALIAVLQSEAARDIAVASAASADISEENAEAAEQLAEGWATAPEDQDVPGAPPGSRSAFHYAQKAEDIVSAVVQSTIHAAPSKNTPDDGDEIGFLDSAASFALKKFTFANLKSYLVSVFGTQTYFDYRVSLSGGNVQLKRYKGQYITVSGLPKVIPLAGLSIAPTGLTPSTLYYIYTHDANADGVIDALEASTTVYVASSSGDYMVKTGDATRTLVGMVYVITGPAFVDSPAQRFVRSWANDPMKAALATFTAQRNGGGTTPTEINSEIRNNIITWDQEVCHVVLAGSTYNTTAGGGCQINIGLDGTNSAAIQTHGGQIAVASGASEVVPFSTTLSQTMTEGLHFFTLIGNSTSSGLPFFYGDVNGRRTTLITRPFAQ